METMNHGHGWRKYMLKWRIGDIGGQLEAMMDGQMMEWVE